MSTLPPATPPRQHHAKEPCLITPHCVPTLMCCSSVLLALRSLSLVEVCRHFRLRRVAKLFLGVLDFLLLRVVAALIILRLGLLRWLCGFWGAGLTPRLLYRNWSNSPTLSAMTSACCRGTNFIILPFLALGREDYEVGTSAGNAGHSRQGWRVRPVSVKMPGGLDCAPNNPVQPLKRRRFF